MRIIVLTGGIASGKSLATIKLKELGAEIIDADIIAREVMPKGGKAYNALRDLFSAYFNSSGELDRRRLKNDIFKDRQLLEQLNKLTHPIIFEEITANLVKFNERGASCVVVAVPLYFDCEYRIDNAKVLNIESRDALRIERLIKRDNISVDLAKNILKAQISNQKRARLSDITIKNNNSINEFYVELEKAFNSLN